MRQVRKLALSKEKSVYALVQNSNISSSLHDGTESHESQADLANLLQNYKLQIPKFKIEQAYKNSIELVANRNKLNWQRQFIFTKIIMLIRKGEINRYNFAVYLKDLLSRKNFLYPNLMMDTALLDNFEFLMLASAVNSSVKLNKLCWSIFSKV